MKYSIKGIINTLDTHSIIQSVNEYKVWRLVADNIHSENIFVFEIWVEEVLEKDSLFQAMKQYVDTLGGEVSWHECTHDEPVTLPCVIDPPNYYRGS